MSLLGLLIACRGEPETDAARFTRLLQVEAPDPEAHLAECAALGDEALRGDCQLAIARSAAASAGKPPEEWCEALSERVWRSECYFMAAEDWNERGDAARAAALCVKATAFNNHCSQHLWQEALRTLTWKKGSEDFAKKLPAAERLYATWAPLLAHETDMEVRFWRRYYQGGFERSGGLQISHCDPLPEPHRTRCREIAAVQYTAQIRRIRDLHRPMRAFCRMEGSADAATTRVPELRAEPAPELDRVIAELQAKLCEDGRPRDGVSPDAVPEPAFLQGGPDAEREPDL